MKKYFNMTRAEIILAESKKTKDLVEEKQLAIEEKKTLRRKIVANNIARKRKEKIRS
jgi:hypothetical protein